MNADPQQYLDELAERRADREASAHWRQPNPRPEPTASRPACREPIEQVVDPRPYISKIREQLSTFHHRGGIA